VSALDGRRTLTGATRAMDAPPVRGYRAGRRRRAGFAVLVARDFAIIITTWAVAAYPILWLMIKVVGPRLFGGTP
jgi:hypothetical protein